MKISKRIEWCMGHRLANHNGKCRNLHGHQYILEVTIEGELNHTAGNSAEGMLVDFSDLKTLLEKKVHDPCDHAFMLAESDQLMINFYTAQPDLKHLIVPFPTTAENIAQWIFNNLSPEIPKLSPPLKLTSVQLWETPFNSALITSAS
ncbi:MAG: 6-carboxytetrahydropterin synthase QueD [Candidatus Altimarinota bacterium]